MANMPLISIPDAAEVVVAGVTLLPGFEAADPVAATLEWHGTTADGFDKAPIR